MADLRDHAPRRPGPTERLHRHRITDGSNYSSVSPLSSEHIHSLQQLGGLAAQGFSPPRTSEGSVVPTLVMHSSNDSAPAPMAACNQQPQLVQQHPDASVAQQASLPMPEAEPNDQLPHHAHAQHNRRSTRLQVQQERQQSQPVDPGQQPVMASREQEVDSPRRHHHDHGHAAGRLARLASVAHRMSDGGIEGADASGSGSPASADISGDDFTGGTSMQAADGTATSTCDKSPDSDNPGPSNSRPAGATTGQGIRRKMSFRPPSNRRQWTDADDRLLLNAVIAEMPHVQARTGVWTRVEAHMNAHRANKNSGPYYVANSIRERWYNHLHKDYDRSSFTPEEDYLIDHFHRLTSQRGRKWCKMEEALPHRSQNNIKNRYCSLDHARKGRNPSIISLKEVPEDHFITHPKVVQHQPHENAEIESLILQARAAAAAKDIADALRAAAKVNVGRGQANAPASVPSTAGVPLTETNTATSNKRRDARAGGGDLGNAWSAKRHKSSGEELNPTVTMHRQVQQRALDTATASESEREGGQPPSLPTRPASASAAAAAGAAMAVLRPHEALRSQVGSEHERVSEVRVDRSVSRQADTSPSASQLRQLQPLLQLLQNLPLAVHHPSDMQARPPWSTAGGGQQGMASNQAALQHDEQYDFLLGGAQQGCGRAGLDRRNPGVQAASWQQLEDEAQDEPQQRPPHAANNQRARYRRQTHYQSDQQFEAFEDERAHEYEVNQPLQRHHIGWQQPRGGAHQADHAASGNTLNLADVLPRRQHEGWNVAYGQIARQDPGSLETRFGRSSVAADNEVGPRAHQHAMYRSEVGPPQLLARPRQKELPTGHMFGAPAQLQRHLLQPPPSQQGLSRGGASAWQGYFTQDARMQEADAAASSLLHMQEPLQDEQFYGGHNVGPTYRLEQQDLPQQQRRWPQHPAADSYHGAAGIPRNVQLHGGGRLMPASMSDQGRPSGGLARHSNVSGTLRPPQQPLQWEQQGYGESLQLPPPLLPPQLQQQLTALGPREGLQEVVAALQDLTAMEARQGGHVNWMPNDVRDLGLKALVVAAQGLMIVLGSAALRQCIPSEAHITALLQVPDRSAHNGPATAALVSVKHALLSVMHPPVPMDASRGFPGG